MRAWAVDEWPHCSGRPQRLRRPSPRPSPKGRGSKPVRGYPTFRVIRSLPRPIGSSSHCQICGLTPCLESRRTRTTRSGADRYAQALVGGRGGCAGDRRYRLGDRLARSFGEPGRGEEEGCGCRGRARIYAGRSGAADARCRSRLPRGAGSGPARLSVRSRRGRTRARREREPGAPMQFISATALETSRATLDAARAQTVIGPIPACRSRWALDEGAEMMQAPMGRAIIGGDIHVDPADAGGGRERFTRRVANPWPEVLLQCWRLQVSPP